MRILGFISMAVGVSMADSASLLVPTILVAVGALLMFVGKED